MFKGGFFKSLKELGMFGKLKMSDYAFERIKVKESIVIPEGCVEISTGAFSGATVKTIELPSTVTYLAGTCFMSAKIENFIFHSTMPPRKYGYWEFLYAQIEHVYVPDESVELYRSSNLADRLVFTPLSEYQG